MTTLFFESLPSTQKWLVERIDTKEVEPPVAVMAKIQTDGIGSRGNRWVGEAGNFFASIALHTSHLPHDLPLTATSVYFMWTVRTVLRGQGSEAWVKWPNDLYVQDRKIGGCITTKRGEVLVAGIGVNLRSAPQKFGVLDISIEPEALLEGVVKELEKKISWKQIFSNYSIEFNKSRNFRAHVEGRSVDLRDAVLQSDGTLKIGEKRVVSIR